MCPRSAVRRPTEHNVCRDVLRPLRCWWPLRTVGLRGIYRVYFEYCSTYMHVYVRTPKYNKFVRQRSLHTIIVVIMCSPTIIQVGNLPAAPTTPPTCSQTVPSADPVKMCGTLASHPAKYTKVSNSKRQERAESSTYMYSCVVSRGLTGAASPGPLTASI